MRHIVTPPHHPPPNLQTLRVEPVPAQGRQRGPPPGHSVYSKTLPTYAELAPDAEVAAGAELAWTAEVAAGIAAEVAAGIWVGLGLVYLPAVTKNQSVGEWTTENPLFY